MSVVTTEDIINRQINERELELLSACSPVYSFPDIEFILDNGIRKHKTPEGVDVIIKYEKKVNPADEFEFKLTIHEAFIGLFGLNSVASSIFARVIQFSMIDGYYYVVYEYIEGITFRKYIKKSSPGQIKSVLLKLFEGLYIAHSSICFTHYDMHRYNIIIRDNSPVIIDYGLSYIKYDNCDYGYEYAAVNRFNRPMWYHDIFKILLHVIAEYVFYHQSSRELIAPIRQLLQFFMDESFDFDFIDTYRTKYVYFQPSNEMINNSYDFTQFMSLARQILL